MLKQLVIFNEIYIYLQIIFEISYDLMYNCKKFSKYLYMICSYKLPNISPFEYINISIYCSSMIS